MFVKKIDIVNFKLFSSDDEFELDNLNTPDGTNEGSGLNVFVGENGSGKSALLEAFALPLLDYKAERLTIDDFNDPEEKIVINIHSGGDFDVTGTMPKVTFKAKGFTFQAGIRSREVKAYLSSMIVSDQLFIKSDPNKPKDGSPDLRTSVNNPFAGKRFNENDVLFLDKSRLFQTRSGSFNTTRFDRLMEDFSWQYLKSSGLEAEDLNKDLNKKVKQGKVENDFLARAIQKFSEISGSEVDLDFLDNYQPFRHAFFNSKKDNNQQITLENLGSGYEMIFALLYSFYLAQQSGKQLIILLDEPELHLHPSLQETFVGVLLEFSKNAQIILASHSPLLVKQLSFNDKVKISVIEDGEEVSEIEERVLPYVSANETNFLAFDLATEEYHNELFEELKYVNADDKSIKDFDNEFFVATQGEPKDSPWRGNANEVSRHTRIRNQIHHQKDNGKTAHDDLKESIEKMRSFF